MNEYLHMFWVFEVTHLINNQQEAARPQTDNYYHFKEIYVFPYHKNTISIFSIYKSYCIKLSVIKTTWPLKDMPWNVLFKYLTELLLSSRLHV